MTTATTGVTSHTRRFGRSIAALLGGFAVVIVLGLGTDILLYQTGVFRALGTPMSDRLLLLATVYRTLYGVIGGYGQGPHWYPLALVVLDIPPAWAGGKLRVLQQQRRAAWR